MGAQFNSNSSLDYAVLETVPDTPSAQRGKISNYESLGFAAFGQAGKLAVIVSKLTYAWGCLVAYTVVLKNNMPSALTDQFCDDESSSSR